MSEFIEKAVKTGAFCPCCGSNMIESTGTANFDGPICNYDVYCLDCEAEWTEIYKLTKIEITKK
ncbi:MAG: hypothetical protein KAS32_31250 [Candidatus Peribacteraceae bacterium]|nr:hypothetical protein [Candidatus Peribacteraceae bacterium]